MNVTFSGMPQRRIETSVRDSAVDGLKQCVDDFLGPAGRQLIVALLACCLQVLSFILLQCKNGCLPFKHRPG